MSTINREAISINENEKQSLCVEGLICEISLCEIYGGGSCLGGGESG